MYISKGDQFCMVSHLLLATANSTQLWNNFRLTERLTFGGIYTTGLQAMLHKAFFDLFMKASVILDSHRGEHYKCKSTAHFITCWSAYLAVYWFYLDQVLVESFGGVVTTVLYSYLREHRASYVVTWSIMIHYELWHLKILCHHILLQNSSQHITFSSTRRPFPVCT